MNALDEISKALDKAGVAIGNEHETYTLAQRVKWMADVKDSLMRSMDELRAREGERYRQTESFNDALRIARGCHDYSGGHHSDGHYEAYHHGIQTVINALEAASKAGLNDTQVAVLWRMGGNHEPTTSSEHHEPEGTRLGDMV